MVQGLKDPDSMLRDEAFAFDANELLALTQQPDGLDLILDAFDERGAQLDAERFEFGDGISVEVYDLQARIPEPEITAEQSIFNHDQDAAGHRTIHNLTESGSGDSFNTARQKEMADEKQKQREDAENKAVANYLLRMQLAGLIEDMRELENFIKAAREALAVGEQNRAAFEAMGSATLSQHYLQFYDGKILPDESGRSAFLDALKNPLRDTDGNLVYLDAQNGLYRLKLDENGEVVNGADGMPIREYYDDFAAHEVPHMMRQILENGTMTAEYTPLGRDIGNIRVHHIFESNLLSEEESAYLNKQYPRDHNQDLPTVHFKTEATGSHIAQICDRNMVCIKEDIAGAQAELSTLRARAKSFGYSAHYEVQEEPKDEVSQDETSEDDIAAASKSSASAESFESGTPAPQYDTGKLPEAIANQIEGGKLNAETLTFAMADLTEEQKAALLRNIESQGVQIVVTNASTIDPALAPYIKDEQKPQIFGGPGIFAHIDDPSENLPAAAVKGTSFAHSLDEELQPSSMRSGFASAAKGPQAAPELAPAAPAPTQTLNNDMLA